MSKTVFVLGAGASTEFAPKGHFPVGETLAQQIADLINDEVRRLRTEGQVGPLLESLYQNRINPPDLRDAMEQIRQSVQDHESIDDLLADWSDRKTMQQLGKMAIAHAILQAEERSFVAELNVHDLTETQEAFEKLRGSWLALLLRYIYRPAYPRRRVHEALAETAFINFNYDRSLERYLFHAFMRKCELSSRDAILAVQSVQVIHPYGSLGPLHVTSPHDGYGSMKADLLHASRNIWTYNEELADSASLMMIRNLMKDAETVVFLGFGFHPKNVEVLLPGGTKLPGKVYATVHGLRGRRLEAARACGNVSDVTCAGLIDQLREELGRD